MDGDLSTIILMKFSLSAGEIMTRFDFPYLISTLSNEHAGDDEGFRVFLISLIACKGMVCLKGPQRILNSFSEISYPVPNQIHPMNKRIGRMMNNWTFAGLRIAGTIPKSISPHINKPNHPSRFEGKYIASPTLDGLLKTALWTFPPVAPQISRAGVILPHPRQFPYCSHHSDCDFSLSKRSLQVFVKGFF
jgi:hypothetical protein